MTAGSKRSRSSHRRHEEHGFGSRSPAPSTPWLVTATDLCLAVTLLAVSIGFGGRMAHGQLALVIGASATAICWALYQFTSSSARWTFTGSEWLWLAGIGVGLVQIIPMPEGWMNWLAPRLKDVIPLWANSEFGDYLHLKWNQLSMAPWETSSGLATFISYGLLFFVIVQRMRTVKDVELGLCGVVLASAAMMLFAQLQYLTSNSKFFWVYEHPYMNTDSYPLGCFTNRNHLAQFLVLGMAPAIWWIVRRMNQQELDRTERRGMPAAMHGVAVSLLLACLGGLVLTVLMTLSRGGLMSIFLSSFVVAILLCRIGLASMKVGTAMIVVGGLACIFLSYSKYETIFASRLEQNTGRQEIWQANIQVAKDFPILGTGVGTHADAYRLHIVTAEDDGLEYSHAECGYLQIASETGLIGLSICLLMIFTSFWWCFAALRNSDTNASSCAAAILASLVANVAHAAVDFFWYAPSCVILLIVQLACAVRLARLARQANGAVAESWRLPRLVTAVGTCALIPVFVWMFDQKLPSALAEPHRIDCILMGRNDEEGWTDEEKLESSQRRLKAALQAAKLDPRDAKLQEVAALVAMQHFEQKQMCSDNSMSASMLRDTIKASSFESAKAANEWLTRAIGPNVKLLRSAITLVKKSLKNGPMRAKSYVMLTELNFLDRLENAEFTQLCLDQALTLRPRDAETMYLVGKAKMQEGEVEQAMTYWKRAFERSRSVQERIVDVLATEVAPEYLEEEFHPDWKGYEFICKAFFRNGREQESRQAQRVMIHKGIAKAKTETSDEEFEKMLISMGNTCRDMGDFAIAADVLTVAAQRIPHSYSVRYRLGLDLFQSGQVVEAADHLQWCAAREPGNQALQKLAMHCVADRIKRNGASGRNDRQVEQISLQHESPR